MMSLLLFLIYLLLVAFTSYLFLRVKTLERWFYLMVGFSFACLAVGQIPTLDYMTPIGLVSLFISVGITVVIQGLKDLSIDYLSALK